MLRMALLDRIRGWFYYVFIRGKDNRSECDLSWPSIIPICIKTLLLTDGDHLLTPEGPEEVESFYPGLLFQNPNTDHRNWAKINTSLHCSKFAIVHHVVYSLWVG